jgi:uncharacterized protein with GYD domain
MPRFVVLIDWTDQGIHAAKDSPARVAQARQAFKPMGVEIESIYWTLGGHDLVAVINATDSESLAAALLQLAGAGNVRSKTLRAFDESEFRTVLGKLG